MDKEDKITVLINHIRDGKQDSELANMLANYLTTFSTVREKISFLKNDFEKGIKDIKINQETITDDPDPALVEYKSPPRLWIIYRFNFPETQKFVRDTLKQLEEKRLEGRIDKAVSGPKSNSAYGLHQENREWIIQTFNEQEKKQPSQNRADKKVQQLYKEKFGMNISKRTIQRFTDR